MLTIYTILLLNIMRVRAIGEKSFEECKNYGQGMLECRNILHPESRVRVPIDVLLYPHMVLIGFRKGPDAEPLWKCGGSLISKDWVLTAAHCKEDPIIGAASVLRVGTATFEFDEIEEIAQERNVAAIVTHPEYKPPSKYHDIALMKAERQFELTRDIRIACLNLDDDISDVNLKVIGFGATRSGAPSGSQTLMDVDVDIINSTMCSRSLRYLIRKKMLSEGVSDNQICAGDYERGGRDTCQGDSGGPLQTMLDRVDCNTSFPLHKVVGVTSFGRDCGRKYSPGVYTKVSKYVDWIESVVWPI